MFLPSVSCSTPAIQITIRKFQRKPVYMKWAIITTLLILILPAVTMAAQVTLAWDPNSPNPDRYIVYQRVDGEPYDYSAPAWPTDGKDHTELTCTLTGLTEGVTYYFVVKAGLGNDASGDSNEVSHKVPVSRVVSDQNRSPVAETGTNQTVTEGTQVSLNAAGSSDPDNDALTYQWTQTGGINVGLNGNTAQCTFTAPNVTDSGVTLQFKLTVSDGSGLSDSDTCTVLVNPSKTSTPSDPPANDQNDIIQQSSDANGIVSIEAEDFTTDATTSSHRWDQVTPSGTSGSSAMQAMPNVGGHYNTDYTTKSPRLDYKVNFVKSGTYFVWVRGKAASGRDDSLHVGLDESAIASCDRLFGFSSSWKWSQNTMDGAVATIKVTTAGQHTINVWMREDGMVFDKILLTASRDYDPNEKQDVSGTNTNSEPVAEAGTNQTVTEGTQVSQNATGSSDNDIVQQSSDANGIVSIEAEDFTTDATTSSHRWDQVTPSGTSGSSAMQAMPNVGGHYNTDYTTKSPRLDYKVNFVKSGTYFVWVRGKAASGRDDSLHVGLDESAIASCDRLFGFSSSWKWSRNTMDGAVATIKVTTAGQHTINVWMREDGMVFDKILLTASRDYDPNEKQDVSGTNTNSEPVTEAGTNQTVTEGTQISQNATGSSDNDIFQQSSDANGIVSIEAEDFTTDTTTNSHRWDQVTPSDTSGSSAMQAMPNVGGHYNTDYTTKSPRLDYKVNFVKSGTYFVWVRGKAASGRDDSLHVGLDESAIASCDRLFGFSSSWKWSRNTMDGAVATIKVTTAGQHTINVWMREDGMVFDKMVITASADYIPTGTGPNEN